MENYGEDDSLMEYAQQELENQASLQQDSVSIIPKGKEKRDAFYQQLNNYINLGFEIEAAKEAQKGILERLFEAKDVDVKKGEHNKIITSRLCRKIYILHVVWSKQLIKII